MAEFPDTRFCHQHSFTPQGIKIPAGETGKDMPGNDGAFFILQLHDELIYEVSDRHVTQVAHIVKNHMENAFALTVKMPVKIKSMITGHKGAAFKGMITSHKVKGMKVSGVKAST
ncbi:hypothetical protein LSAT2_018239 [Lamellibrachia satsuma]|nr:hypothetical protein LSAT2_018239 [Lamellibrachia satsuma]